MVKDTVICGPVLGIVNDRQSKDVRKKKIDSNKLLVARPIEREIVMQQPVVQTLNGKRAADCGHLSLTNDDAQKRALLSHLETLNTVSDRLSFVQALSSNLRNELTSKDVRMGKAEMIASVVREAMSSCTTFEIRELVSILKSKAEAFRAKLTEDPEVRAHPVLAALFKYDLDDSRPHKWQGAKFNTWIKREICADGWQEGYRRILVELTQELERRQDELSPSQKASLRVLQLGRKCDKESLPFLLLPNGYDLIESLAEGRFVARGLIQELPRSIKDRHVLQAFGKLPDYSGDKDYSCQLHIFCKRGVSLPHGRGVVTLYKRGGDWRVGGLPRDSEVVPSLVSFLKNPYLFRMV